MRLSRLLLLLLLLLSIAAGNEQETGGDGVVGNVDPLSSSSSSSSSLEQDEEQLAKEIELQMMTMAAEESTLMAMSPTEGMVALTDASLQLLLKIEFVSPKDGDLLRPYYNPETHSPETPLEIRLNATGADVDDVWIDFFLDDAIVSKNKSIHLPIRTVVYKTGTLTLKACTSSTCSQISINLESWVPHPGLGPIHLYSVFSPSFNEDFLHDDSIATRLRHEKFKSNSPACQHACNPAWVDSRESCPEYQRWLEEESCPGYSFHSEKNGVGNDDDDDINRPDNNNNNDDKIKKNPWKIAIVSSNTRDAEHPAFGISKSCYAARHGYAYFETHEPAPEDRKDHWTRVALVQRYLPFYDWVVWLDYDTVITNAHVKIEDFLPDPGIDSKIPDNRKIHLVVTDWMHIICTGGFILRNHPWSYDFLSLWWDYGSSQYAQSYFDQGAFNRAWMALVVEAMGVSMSAHAHILDMYLLASFFHYIDRPFGARGCVSHVFLWSPQLQNPRGFNFFARNREDVVAGFHSCNMYLPNDMLLHSHDNRAVAAHARWPEIQTTCLLPHPGHFNLTTRLVDAPEGALYGTEKWQAAYVPYK